MRSEIIRLCLITPVPRCRPPSRRHQPGVGSFRCSTSGQKFRLADAAISGELFSACIVLLQVGTPPGPVTLMGRLVDAVEVVLLSASSGGGDTGFRWFASDTPFILALATVRGAVKTPCESGHGSWGYWRHWSPSRSPRISKP